MRSPLCQDSGTRSSKHSASMSCATWCESTGFSSHASTAGGGCPCNMLEPTKAESWEQLLRREAALRMHHNAHTSLRVGLCGAVEQDAPCGTPALTGTTVKKNSHLSSLTESANSAGCAPSLAGGIYCTRENARRQVASPMSKVTLEAARPRAAHAHAVRANRARDAPPERCTRRLPARSPTAGGDRGARRARLVVRATGAPPAVAGSQAAAAGGAPRAAECDAAPRADAARAAPGCARSASGSPPRCAAARPRRRPRARRELAAGCRRAAAGVGGESRRRRCAPSSAGGGGAATRDERLRQTQVTRERQAAAAAESLVAAGAGGGGDGGAALAESRDAAHLPAPRAPPSSRSWRSCSRRSRSSRARWRRRRAAPPPPSRNSSRRRLRRATHYRSGRSSCNELRRSCA